MPRFLVEKHVLEVRYRVEARASAPRTSQVPIIPYRGN